MKRLRIGVVGVGHLGRYHVLKFASLPEVELTAVVDINEKQLTRIKKELEKEFPKCKPVFTTFYKEIKDLVDAVSIVTPTFAHYEIGSFFLSSGKPVFMEKPIASSVEQAEALVELAEKKDLVLQVGYVERFHPAVKKLRSLVKNPLFIEAHRLSNFPNRNLDIDVILDLMIHDIDLVLSFKKEQKVEFLHAVGAPVFTELPDIVNARIVFEDGTTCNLTASRISIKRQRRFRVFEVGCYMLVDTLANTFYRLEVNKKNRSYTEDKEYFESPDPLKDELKSFVLCVIQNKKPEVSGKEALNSLRLAFQIIGEVEKNLRRFV